MTVDPRVPCFDIFSGESYRDAEWLETVEGLAAALNRMDDLANEKPGKYFVFSLQTYQILARADAEHSRDQSARQVA